MLGTQLLLKAKYLRKGDALVAYSCPTVSALLPLTPDLPEVQRDLDTLYVWVSHGVDCFTPLKSASVIQVFDSLFSMADACYPASSVHSTVNQKWYQAEIVYFQSFSSFLVIKVFVSFAGEGKVVKSLFSTLTFKD